VVAELITAKAARDLMMQDEKTQEAIAGINLKIDAAARGGKNSCVVSLENLPNIVKELLVKSSFRVEICKLSNLAQIVW
jgi:hypothetical protein